MSYLLPAFQGAPEHQFVLRIEIESNLYFGVCNWDDATKTNPHDTSDPNNSEYIRSHSDSFGNEKGTSAFYWWKHLGREWEKINFRDCNKNYEMLYDEQLFQDIVDAVCSEVREFFDIWKT